MEETLVKKQNYPEDSIFIKYYESLNYPVDSPYHPSQKHPEYPFKENISINKNTVYDSIRNLFCEMSLDIKNYNTKKWNPFGSFIKPGNNVLIKPNMVNHFHPLGFNMDCLITHGSVIRCVTDYVIIALRGKGRITIGDAPIQSANFDQTRKLNGLDKIIQFYNEQSLDIDIEIIDFREMKVEQNSKGHIVSKKAQKNVEFKYVELNKNSHFSNVVRDKYVVADYPEEAMRRYHNVNFHRYLVPDRLLDSHVIINLPKPKTHRYSGMTGAMKNFIGINSQKENMPHYTRGSCKKSGDEYPERNIRKYLIGNLSNSITKMGLSGFYYFSIPLFIIRKLLILTLNKNEIYRGTWYGNDTMWRTILDVIKIVLYANKNGEIANNKQRIIFTLADAIIIGEKDGPLTPTPYKMNSFIAGFNMYAIDRILVQLMGFEPNYIKSLRNCTKELGLIDDKRLTIILNNKKVSLKDLNYHNIIPAKGWEIIKQKNESRFN